MLVISLAGPPSFPFVILRCLFFVTIFVFVGASPSNVTIDDKTGDPTTHVLPLYQPPKAWVVGPGCGAKCTVKADRTQAYGSSWHETLVTPSDNNPTNMTLTFTGTAVYVYSILPNLPDQGTPVNLAFRMDGEDKKSFFHQSNHSQIMQYDALVFSQEQMENKEHNLIITPTTAASGSVFLFDYAIYTVDDTSSSPSSPTSQSSPSSPATSLSSPPSSSASSSSSLVPIAAIVGSALGALIILSGLVFLFLCIRRRKRTGSVEDRQFRDMKTQPPCHNLSTSRTNNSKSSFAESETDQVHKFSDVAVSELPPMVGYNAHVTNPTIDAKARLREMDLHRQLEDVNVGPEFTRSKPAVSQRISTVSSTPTNVFVGGQSPAGPDSENKLGRGARGRNAKSLLRQRLDGIQTEINRLSETSNIPEVPPPAYEGSVSSPVCMK